MTRGLSKQLVQNTDTAFDVLYYSDVEWEDSTSIAIAEAKKGGRLIYENL